MHAHPGRWLLASLVLAGAVSAQTVEQSFVEGFESGSNAGGWEWFLAEPTVIAPSGGDPGAFLTGPQWTSPGASIRTTEAGSPFTGDLRAAGVVSFGVDFQSFVLQEDIGNPAFDAFRFTIVIGHAAGTPGNFFDDTAFSFKTDLFLPLVGEGWKTYEVAVPSQADETPSGWELVEFSLGGPNPDPLRWDQVLSDVDYVWLLYNDVDGFYIFANWRLGADDVTVTMLTGNAFVDLGGGLAGTHGVPQLVADSLLVEGADIDLSLGAALEGATAFLVVGAAELSAPFKGGVLVPDPSPPGFFLPLPTGASGGFTLEADWPPGLPAGVEVLLQAWIPDPAGPKGFAASNALRGVSS